jgi:hypothetical protein
MATLDVQQGKLDEPYRFWQILRTSSPRTSRWDRALKSSLARFDLENQEWKRLSNLTAVLSILLLLNLKPFRWPRSLVGFLSLLSKGISKWQHGIHPQNGDIRFNLKMAVSDFRRCH